MRNLIITCTIMSSFAFKIWSQPLPLQFSTPIKLGSEINTNCDETAAIISKDGKMMFFARVYCEQNIGGAKAGQDIWYSKKDTTGKWSLAERLPPSINNKLNNAPSAFIQEKGILYVNNIYTIDGKIVPGFSYSVKNKASLWTFPVPITVTNANLQSNSLFGYTVSQDERVMVISKPVKKYNDQEDLFVSFRKEKDVWSEPINMGKTINSPGFETSPFLANNDSTLFFSSNGWGGYGDGDIFYSTRLDSTFTKWSKPQNIGSIINTKGFDAFFTITKGGEAYFVRGQNADSSGDIYYTSIIKKIDSVPVAIVKTIEKPPIIFKPVLTFDRGEAIINEEGFLYLNTLIATMKQNPKLDVVLYGYTDNIGTVQDNLKLSIQRTRVVKEYLIKNKIKASRIKIKGIGEAEAIASNDTEEGRQLNRRVEILLPKIKGNKQKK